MWENVRTDCAMIIGFEVHHNFLFLFPPPAAIYSNGNDVIERRGQKQLINIVAAFALHAAACSEICLVVDMEGSSAETVSTHSTVGFYS